MRQPKFIPILMSTPMVVATLNDTKGQTRRTKGLDKLIDCSDSHKKYVESSFMPLLAEL